MRSLFLLFVVILFFSLIQVVKPKDQLEVLIIQKSQLVDFSGSVFLPVKLPRVEGEVNPKKLELSIAGKIYTYAPKYNGFYLEGVEAREVPVLAGDEIKITGTNSVRLFFVRENGT